jgi:hypothetical protein
MGESEHLSLFQMLAMKTKRFCEVQFAEENKAK